VGGLSFNPLVSRIFTKSAQTSSATADYDAFVQNFTQRGLTSQSTPQASPATDPTRVAPPTDPWAKQLLLGDLNFKQNKYTEAKEAYQQVLGLLSKKAESPAENLRCLLVAVEVANRLAQVYVAQGDQKKAAEMLEMASRAVERASKLAPATKSPPSSGQVPAQLIISATKENLDKVGAGKMTLEEFRKASSIEYRTSEEEKPAK
jgi:tetratricopeptide (TPR) repeat protein